MQKQRLWPHRCWCPVALPPSLSRCWHKWWRREPADEAVAAHNCRKSCFSFLWCYFHLTVEYLLFSLTFCVSSVASQHPVKRKKERKGSKPKGQEFVLLAWREAPPEWSTSWQHRTPTQKRNHAHPLFTTKPDFILVIFPRLKDSGVAGQRKDCNSSFCSAYANTRGFLSDCQIYLLLRELVSLMISKKK